MSDGGAPTHEVSLLVVTITPNSSLFGAIGGKKHRTNDETRAGADLSNLWA
jgi:hypothetical protein